MLEFGITPAEFRNSFFEQRPRHFPGALTERPFTWSSIDRILHILEPTEPTVRLFHHGQLRQHSFTEEFSEVGKVRRRLNKAKFYDYMRNGATLQINWLERHSIEAKRLCLEVGRFVRAQTTGNAYLSFSGDGTFGEHWDTHDVFAIQLIGRKRWRIFPPTFPLPLTFQTHDRSGHQCPTDPVMELVMEEGDMLYLPRGWWHHVVPLEIGSFHFSVGCYLPTLFDYIVQTLAKHLEQLPSARRSFSAETFRESVQEAFEKLSGVLLDPANAAAFERDSANRERMDAEFHLAALDSAAAPFSDSALVSLTTFGTPTLPDGMLTVNGHQRQLDPVSRAVVAALSDRRLLRFGELCERLENAEPDTVRRAVLDLARHDIVTLQS